MKTFPGNRSVVPGAAAFRRTIPWICCAGCLWLAGGCRTPGATADPAAEGAAATARAEPRRPVGTVRAVDPDNRLAVVDFGVDRPPAPGARMRVRRKDRIVGRLVIVGPISPPFATAKILDGDAAAGDLAE